MISRSEKDRQPERDTTGKYLIDMSRLPIPTREEEQEIGKRIHDAREAIVGVLCASRDALSVIVALAAKVRLQDIRLSDISEAHREPGYDEGCAEIAFLEAAKRVESSYRRKVPLAANDFHALKLSTEGQQRVVTDLRKRPASPELSASLASLAVADRAFVAARNELVSRNLRLVIEHAKRNVNRGVDFQDLIQEGNKGLITAAGYFDFSLGYKFSTYATWHIRQSVDRAVDNMGRTIRIPVHLADKMKLVRITKRRLEAQDVVATPEAIERVSGIRIDHIKQCLELVTGVVSMQAPMGDDGGHEIGDFVPANEKPQDETVSDSRLTDSVRDLLVSLSPREREVVQRRFGINRKGEETLEDIGVAFGVTRERIRQIEVKALRNLSHPARITKLAALAREFGMQATRRFAGQ